MVTIMPAAPLDAAAVLPDLLLQQHVKPAEDDVALLSALRLTALTWIEGHTRRSLKRRAWLASFDWFEAALRLPCDPVRSVTSLTYVDPNGATISGAGLWDLAGGAVIPLAGTRWPATASRIAAISVTFDAGYDDLAMEAPALQVAALMLVRHLYDGGSFDDAPKTILMLLDEPYRTPVIACA